MHELESLLMNHKSARLTVSAFNLAMNNEHILTCFVFQSVLVTLLAVTLAMYLTRKSLKQGTSPPAAAPPAPSTPAPAKQPEEVTLFSLLWTFKERS